MNSKKDLLDLIDKSRLTLIGYNFLDERIKDELISNFNYVEIKEIGPSFSFKSFLRTEKLNQVLYGGKKFEYVLLDLNSIQPTYDGESKWDRISFIRNVLEKISERVWVESPDYKVIVISPLNRTITNDQKDIIGSHFTGGNQPLHMADLAVIIKDDIAKVVKNRYGVENSDYILFDNKQIVEI